MPYAPLLTEAEIAASLPSIPGWRREAEELVRTFRCDTFRAAIALVTRVADAAEAADHHPDIQINWRRVTFRITTKASHGLTAKDVAYTFTRDIRPGSTELADNTAYVANITSAVATGPAPTRSGNLKKP